MNKNYKIVLYNMMDVTKIHSFNSFVRMMYAYSTPEIARHDGWLKIGDTEQGVNKRIKQQTHTADVRFELEWKDIAMYRDDCTYFRDHDFHVRSLCKVSCWT